MKIMGLIDKLRESGKRARGLALAGVLGLSGCLLVKQVPDRWDLFGFDERRNQEGSVQKNSDTIKQNPDSEKVLYFTCNDIRDIDGNNQADYPYDFKGIRKQEVGEFLENEDIYVVGLGFCFPRLIGHIVKKGEIVPQDVDEIKLIVLNDKEDLIYKDSISLPVNKQGNFWKKFAAGELKPGNYSAYWITPDFGERPVKYEIRFGIMRSPITASQK